MIAVPAGCIAEGWPEREHQVGRVNADTEGSVEQGVSLGWSEQGVQPGPWALLKSGGFPLPPGLTHLSFSPLAFLKARLS